MLTFLFSSFCSLLSAFICANQRLITNLYFEIRMISQKRRTAGLHEPVVQRGAEAQRWHRDRSDHFYPAILVLTPSEGKTYSPTLVHP